MQQGDLVRSLQQWEELSSKKEVHRFLNHFDHLFRCTSLKSIKKKKSQLLIKIEKEKIYS